MSSGPEPTTWYAIATSPLRAYLTSGISTSAPGLLSVGAHIRNGVETPQPRHTFQLVLAALLEVDACPCDEVLHRLRDEHLAPAGERGDAGADYDGEAGN